MNDEQKRYGLFCAIITGMISNTNGGNLVWGNAESQQQIIDSAQRMALLAYPVEIPTPQVLPVIEVADVEHQGVVA
jgi:hypothetical protein